MKDFDFYESIVKHLSSIKAGPSDLALIIKEAELRLAESKSKLKRQSKSCVMDYDKKVAENKEAMDDMRFGIGMDHRDPYGSW
jgi:hypothetical protein